MMEARDVLDVVATLQAVEIPVWIDGGWGVDALLAGQYRDHDDLDLVVEIDRLDDAVATLTEVAFTVTSDERPTRVAMTDHTGRRVDFHPVRFDADGVGWQGGGMPDGSDARYPRGELTYGWVAGTRVECISERLQMLHHTGYPPRERDVHDVHLLFRQFNLALPPEYR